MNRDTLIIIDSIWTVALLTAAVILLRGWLRRRAYRRQRWQP